MPTTYPIPDHPKFIDLVGQRYGRLTIVSYAGHAKNSRSCWNCVCDCGAEFVATGCLLRQGCTSSCGCLRKEHAVNINYVHGQTESPEWNSWIGMIRRCTNPKYKGFERYGGRGIQVCERWSIFENFIADMGHKPTPLHSIDRFPNVDGNYEPSNCRWATSKQQAQNRRDNALLTFRGETKCITAWEEQFGFSRFTIRQRLNRGWPVEKALTTPIKSS